MAPEQAAGDVVDSRADIYAFGCLAYEMLTGTPPFTGSAQALMAAHAMRTPVPLTEQRPGVTPTVAALVMRCLEKRPADRPQTAREVIEALDAIGTPTTGGIPSVIVSTKKSKGSLAVGIVAAVVLVAGIMYFTLRAPQATQRNDVVAVTPFRVAGADASMRNLREGMLDLISAKLSGAVHAVDSRTTLSAWRKHGGAETSDLTRQDALALASELGAGRLLEGEIVGSPDHLVVSATLVSAPGGQVRASARATGTHQALASLVDSVMAEVLVQEAGASDVQARRLAGIPFDALQAYLTGQALYRKGRFEDAVAAFSRAVDIDSTFALAGIQLNLTATWTSVPGAATRGLRIALGRYAGLTERERMLLGGNDTLWLRGKRLSCSEANAFAERAVTRAPDVPEAWYFLGDNLFHCGWVFISGDDPWRRAIAPLERALAVDSTFAPAREHLPLLYAYVGDTARARRAIAVMRADSADFADINLFTLGMMPDSAERARFIARQVAHPLSIAPALATWSTWAGRYESDGERVLVGLKAAAATDAERQRLAQAEASFALNMGQPQRAARAAQAAKASAPQMVLAAVFWDGDTSIARVALDTALRAIGSRPSPDSASVWTDRVFAAGQWMLEHGDTATAHRATSALRGVTAPADAPWLGERPKQLAVLLDAQMAARAKRPDAGALLAASDSIVRLGAPGNYVMSAGSIIVARLWEASGNLENAYAMSKRIQYSAAVTGPSFWAPRVLERARIAAALGKREDAIAQYELFLRLRAKPEPALAGQVAAARKELDRLTAASR